MNLSNSIQLLFSLAHPLAPLSKELAYLDPGSGSFLLQLIIAGFLGLAFALRAYWTKIKSFFQGSNPEEMEEPVDEE